MRHKTKVKSQRHKIKTIKSIRNKVNRYVSNKHGMKSKTTKTEHEMGLNRFTKA